jgi:hypothetical protein
MLPVNFVGRNQGSRCFAGTVNAKFCTTLKINKMDTLSHSDEPEDFASACIHNAYYQKVKELLNQNNAETGIEDL